MALSGTSKAVIGEDRARNTGSEGTQTNGRGEAIGRRDPETTSGIQTNRVLIVDEQSEQLLPCIPNEITLDHICTKLPWRVYYILSAVSRCWKRALQSRQVYDARVRSHSTETFVLFDHSTDHDCIHLYSIRDKFCYNLPQFPNALWDCHCVSLDGKIYVLGAVTSLNRYKESAEVYVLDLAGERQWQQCARMLNSRQQFGCGIFDGKIYVFGGTSRHKSLLGSSEVYDPKVGAWFPIKPMPSSRTNHQVAVIGEELFVCGGRYRGAHFSGRDASRADGDGDVDNKLYLEAYHPTKNDWRVIKPFRPRSKLESVFVAKGKFCSMTGLGIDFHDFDKNSWTNLHKNSFRGVGITDDELQSDEDEDDVEIEPGVTVSLNEELLAVVNWEVTGKFYFQSHVVQSKGFGRDQKEIVWEYSELNDLIQTTPSFMIPVQL